ncbi:hypothetical protein ACJIZ3_003420 [Penstemon smallii]|uniref:Uncharacterized protein n=1 Tax=Penstemon smallii TaxID=265156 RepID=A0ABD3U966_9LAMI
MVAISLYKGNLHKVPDVPRLWPAPTPKISLKDFKILLRRRSRALSRLLSSATTSNPNPNSDNPNGHSTPTVNNNNNNNREIDLPAPEDLKEKEVEEKVTEDAGDAVKKLVEKADSLVEEKNEENVKNLETESPSDPVIERNNTEDATSDKEKSDKEKRIKEVKEKLEILNEKKHSLVQVLKQILNAEEQLKRQNSMQGMSGRPPLPLQVDTTTDSGSMTRVNTPRLGSDGNPCGDMDGGEADDGLNHTLHSRQLLRMSSTSPSSDSQQRKPSLNMVPHSYRTTLGVGASPSRFAPAGQGHSSVSASVTSYIASSPSPAASGGTSVFRDVRFPSPWN